MYLHYCIIIVIKNFIISLIHVIISQGSDKVKTLIIPSNLKQAQNSNCDGIIIGLNKLSVNMPNYFKIEDIKKIENKEIFVCLNKNIHNKDLNILEQTLSELNKYNIKGVIFYDVAISNLAKKLNLNYELVWNQEHMTNNYYTINFWQEQNVNYTWVSNDITLREMQEIKENTTSKLMVTLFGYLPMFVSLRKLIKNYLNTFDLNDNSKINFMEKEDKIYPLIDNEEGTIVYTDFILNGLKEKILLEYDYIVLNSFMIDDENFKKVLDIFNKVNKDNIDELEKKLNNMFNNLKKGFFYEETIYKVK